LYIEFYDLLEILGLNFGVSSLEKSSPRPSEKKCGARSVRNEFPLLYEYEFVDCGFVIGFQFQEVDTIGHRTI
jgi:hypothetical protein